MKAEAVFGPPGTGKTRNLVERAAGKRGLFLSYTRAAAQEAASRIEGTGMKASTIHSLAFNALSMNRMAVVDAEKLARFAKETGIPFKGSEPGSDEPQEGDEYYAVLQFANNRMMPTMEAYDYFGCPGDRLRFAMFVDSYQAWKKTFGYMDFDDMLIHFSQAIPASLPVPRGCVVYLDEAQDSSPLQWAAFKNLCGALEPSEIVIAGDDDQAIYEWSGADPHGMVNFIDQNDGSITVLQQSYRLPKSIWSKANVLIRSIDKRVQKKFKARPGDQGVVERWGSSDDVIANLADVAPDGGLILVRDRFKMEEMKKALNRDLIPYAVQGGYGPWTSKIANELREGKKPLIPNAWREFYAQADLTKPINYTLSTIHSAKGREHETVILDLDLPARVLNNLSLDRDPETRVQYVGLTRAKSKLILCGDNPIV